MVSPQCYQHHHEKCGGAEGVQTVIRDQSGRMLTSAEMISFCDCACHKEEGKNPIETVKVN